MRPAGLLHLLKQFLFVPARCFCSQALSASLSNPYKVHYSSSLTLQFLEPSLLTCFIGDFFPHHLPYSSIRRGACSVFQLHVVFSR